MQQILAGSDDRLRYDGLVQRCMHISAWLALASLDVMSLMACQVTRRGWAWKDLKSRSMTSGQGKA